MLARQLSWIAFQQNLPVREKEHAVADLRQEMRSGIRTVDEHIAEIKDLILGRRNGT